MPFCIAHYVHISIPTLSYTLYPLQEVEGVLLGLGGCAVDADGCALPPSKMSQEALRIELREAGVAGAAEMSKKELTTAIKVYGADVLVEVGMPAFH